MLEDVKKMYAVHLTEDRFGCSYGNVFKWEVNVGTTKDRKRIYTEIYQDLKANLENKIKSLPEGESFPLNRLITEKNKKIKEIKNSFIYKYFPFTDKSLAKKINRIENEYKGRIDESITRERMIKQLRESPQELDRRYHRQMKVVDEEPLNFVEIANMEASKVIKSNSEVMTDPKLLSAMESYEKLISSYYMEIERKSHFAYENMKITEVTPTDLENINNLEQTFNFETKAKVIQVALANLNVEKEEKAQTLERELINRERHHTPKKSLEYYYDKSDSLGIELYFFKNQTYAISRLNDTFDALIKRGNLSDIKQHLNELDKKLETNFKLKGRDRENINSEIAENLARSEDLPSKSNEQSHKKRSYSNQALEL